jgi:pyruvate dehydrogenase (quinone)
LTRLYLNSDRFASARRVDRKSRQIAPGQPFGEGVRVESPQDLRAAVQDVLGHKGPALLDVVSVRQKLVMPPTTTFDEAYKFGVFMLKAVLDGRAGELIDLAKVNLTR